MQAYARLAICSGVLLTLFCSTLQLQFLCGSSHWAANIPLVLWLLCSSILLASFLNVLSAFVTWWVDKDVGRQLRLYWLWSMPESRAS